jgi:serine/threonine-protein kinase
MGRCIVQVDPEEWATLSRLLDEALDMECEARERWLEALAPAHAGYKDKLRALLRHDVGNETRGFRDVFPNLMESRERPAFPDITPGTMVGPYIVEAEIGRGGMGVVWRARRIDGIKRPVALKLPHAGLYAHDPIERFESERDILGELAHPNIARLYDAGVAANGQPYLALEYVAGVPLTDYCDQHRLDIEQRLHLFQQVLRAVQYAHGRLVIHRDLKPTNVIVGPDGRAMLLDFGIANLIASESGESKGRLAQVAALTPDYASPEQIMGGPMTIASDVYSLGVLLFELLTGDRPYRLQQDAHGSFDEAISSIKMPRPSQSIRGEAAARVRNSTPQALARTLRGDLDAIVLQALKKTPEERYSTADALLHDIDRYLRDAPVTVRADSGFYRVTKLVARNKLSVAVGAMAITVLLATAACALWQARAAQVERDRALALSSRNQAVAEFLNVLMTEAGGAGKPVSVGDMLAHSETLVNAEFRDRPEHRAAVLDLLGSYYHTAGKDSRAEPLLREALNATKNSPDGDLRRQLTCTHALSLAGLGKLREAAGILRRVAEDPATSTEQAASCLEYLAYIAQDEGNAEDALKYAQAALEKLHQLPHPSPLQEAVFLGSMGYAEHLRGRNSDAESFYALSLAKFAKSAREAGPLAISVRNNWAIVSDGAGNPKRALTLYDETLRLIAEANANAAPPQYLISNRAHALEGIGRFQDAAHGYKQCRSMPQGEGTPYLYAYCSLGLASIAVQLGNLAAADEYVDEAVVTLRASTPHDSPLDVAVKTMRARIALQRGRFDDARGHLNAAIERGKDGYLTAASILVRAELNLVENRLAAAESDARRALTFAQQTQGDLPFSSRTGAAWLLLGRVLVQQGHTDQAHNAFVGAVTNLSNTVEASHPLLLMARELAGERANALVARR